MATGKSGYIDVTVMPSSVGKVRVYWREDYDSVNNYSTITITDIQGYISHRSGWANLTLTVKAGDVTILNNNTDWMLSCQADGTFRRIVKRSSYTTEWTSITSDPIYHNDDGTKTITITFTLVDCIISSVGFNATDNQSASASVALTAIPRASALTAGNGTLASAQTLTVDRKASSYTHTITYACGSASGTICTKSSSLSISWTPPISLASQNTTGTSVPITLTITTYSGDTVIGSKETSIKCTIPSSVCLKVSDGWATLSPYNTGTAAAAIDAYVQGYSKAAVVFDASKISTDDAYGATIQSYRITCGGKQYTSPYRTDVLASAGTVTVTVTVIDSRGYGVNEDFTVNVAAYANPVLSGISVFRCNSSGVAADDGTYLSVTAKANISSVEGLNTCTMELAIGSLMTVSVPDSETIIVGDGLVLSTSTYSVRLTLTDSLGNRAVYTQKIPTAEVFFHGRTGGSGAAFGKYAEADDLLDVDWNIRGRKDMQIDGDTNIDGALTVDGTLQANAINASDIVGPNRIELGCNLTSASCHGGYIDFHYNGSTADYTARIIENGEGKLSFFTSNGLVINNNTLADYVVAQGTSGIWTYRKWNSGIAECWGKATTQGSSGTSTFGPTSSMPYIYYSATFPFTFSSTPIVTIGGTDSGSGIATGNVTVVSTTYVETSLFGASAAYGGGCNIYAIGKWK